MKPGDMQQSLPAVAARISKSNEGGLHILLRISCSTRTLTRGCALIRPVVKQKANI